MLSVSACQWLLQGRNHGWQVEGDQGLSPNTGALVPRARSKAGLGVGCGRGCGRGPHSGRGRPAAVRVRGYHPGNFLKTQMLNPAFWWVLAVKFLAFWKLRPRSWGGTNTLLVPQPISWGDQSSPVPTVVAPMCCCLCTRLSVYVCLSVCLSVQVTGNAIIRYLKLVSFSHFRRCQLQRNTKYRITSLDEFFETTQHLVHLSNCRPSTVFNVSTELMNIFTRCSAIAERPRCRVH